ncbi:hypothetical protein BaRGS_00031926 [Batillaria attramentaria]|uniref:Uncharacterized protein n=1 Tax=Batillaria attramentaria TaxID=370345 RepID=A0ABD0JQ47_9CAEN
MNDTAVVVSDSDEGSDEEFVLAPEQLKGAENEMTVLLVPAETNAASPGSQQDTPFAQGNNRPPGQADETLTGTAESKTGTTTEGSEVTGTRSEHENSRTDE